MISDINNNLCINNWRVRHEVQKWDKMFEKIKYALILQRYMELLLYDHLNVTKILNYQTNLSLQNNGAIIEQLIIYACE